MTERILPGIGLTGYWDLGAPWKVGGDQNWLRASVLTQLAVESATTSLPASPLNGVIYIVPAADANANQVAARDNGAWVYFPPFEGLTAYVRDTNVLMNFDGAAWVPSTAPLSAALASDTGTAAVKGTWFGGVIAYLSDLATSAGSALIGFIQACTGAVARSSQSKLRDVVTLFDVIPVAEHAAIIAGTSTYDCSADFANLLADSSVKKIEGAPGHIYWFGTVTGNTSKFTCTRDVVIDWGGAEISCAGQNTGAFTDTAFITFRDCRASMSNYVFDDINFNIVSGPSRGVMPVLILADAASTKGHSLGPMHVKRGQSLLTCASTSPLLYRSDGINFVGACTFDDAYYGINAANNGDNIFARYSGNRVDRLFFGYGIDGGDVVAYAAAPIASSANLLISATGTGFPDTKNIKVQARFGAMNGPAVIADQSAANGSGMYSNIDLTIVAESYGSNLNATLPAVKVGAFDVSGNFYTVEKSTRMDDVRVSYQPPLSSANLDDSVIVYTPSPNYGKFSFNNESQYNIYSLFPKNAGGVFMGPASLESDGKYTAAVWGDLTNVNAVAKIPAKYLAVKNKNTAVALLLSCFAANSVGTSVPYTRTEFLVVGTLDGSGAFTIETPASIGTVNGNGTPCTFTIAVSGPGDFLTVTASLYTSSSALLRVTVTPY